MNFYRMYFKLYAQLITVKQVNSNQNDSCSDISRILSNRLMFANVKSDQEQECLGKV